jgi:hypothetical protein
MKLQTWSKITNGGDFLTKKTISDEPFDEVATIHAAFFKKSKEKQRKVLRILIWWAIKQYFKNK